MRVNFLNKIIYADNAATTKLSPTAFEAMKPYLLDIYGNPSSLYKLGIQSRKAVDTARETVANCINAEPREIFFLSGGSEADNWAIKGAAELGARKGKKHIISSKFEHHAVLHTLEYLEKHGFEVTLLDVHKDGLVRPEELENAIREDTALVTIMTANNEIGTIQPVKELAAICKKHNVLFHTDAVQAVGTIPIDVKDIGCDMLSMSGHKFHGPKGVGAIYIRKGIILPNLIHGGAQERGMRAGTENIAGVVGMSVALKESCEKMAVRNARLEKMRDRLIDGLLKINRSHINGDRISRLPGNVNMCFEGVEGESLLLMLDMKGIEASSGSACTSGSLDPSHVLLAIGLPHEIAHGSLRLTFSDDNTEEDIDEILTAVPSVVEKLRSMSPLWEKIIKENK
ncbi:MAG: cysteine desulfurase NifS [Clostridia bacterium]|nr:cysteine desulfurase NifS [Clostridia bacterium]